MASRHHLGKCVVVDASGTGCCRFITGSGKVAGAIYADVSGKPCPISAVRVPVARPAANDS